MTVVSEVVTVPAATRAKIKPKEDKTWRVTSLVTEEECGIRFQSDGDDEEEEEGTSHKTKLLLFNKEMLDVEVYIKNNQYIVVESVDQNEHTAFYSAEVA